MLTSWPVKEELIMMKGGWAMRTCSGCGSQAWFGCFPNTGVWWLLSGIAVAFTHGFVTTWLGGSLRSQLERRTNEGKRDEIRQKSEIQSLSSVQIFPPHPCFPPRQRAPTESMLLWSEMRTWITHLTLPFLAPLGKWRFFSVFPMIYKVIISCSCTEV